MISATPALSSAPSRVVPDAVTMSLPAWCSSAGQLPMPTTIAGSSGSAMSCPFQPRCTIGFTPAPLASGEVSTCAIRPITGTFGLFVVAGSVPNT